jgi:hypothetical protein
MRRRTSSARRRRRLAANEISEECSAFLAGSYRGYLEICGRPVPAWAWLNALAHGDRIDIEIEATTCSGDDTPEAVVGELAAAVVAALERGEELVGLQRNTLIPLELALSATTYAVPTNGVELARALRSAVRNGLEPIRTRRSDP